MCACMHACVHACMWYISIVLSVGDICPECVVFIQCPECVWYLSSVLSVGDIFPECVPVVLIHCPECR